MEKIKKWLKEWVVNRDLFTLIAGVILVYFAEPIVTFLYPLDPVPPGIIPILYYFVFFSVAAFWFFNGVAFHTIKLFWRNIHEYFNAEFVNDFQKLTAWQKICFSLALYCFLFYLLVTVFRAVLQAM